MESTDYPVPPVQRELPVRPVQRVLQELPGRLVWMVLTAGTVKTACRDRWAPPGLKDYLA